MEKVTVSVLDEQTVRKLYFDVQLTDREIGNVFGLTQDAVAWKRKKFSIDTIPPSARKKRKDVEIEFIGLRKDRGKALTNDILKELYLIKKLTDEQIGNLYNISSAVVGYRRKSLGIKGRDADTRRKEFNENRGLKDIADLTRDEIIEELKVCRGIKGFCRKYVTGFVTVKDILNEKQIVLKDYLKKLEDLTSIQYELLIGGLLGDGGLSGSRNDLYRYQEYHCLEQEAYLNWKMEILGNLVTNVRYVEDDRFLGKPSHGKVFQTHVNVGFSDLHQMFYKDYDTIKNKRIPEEVIEELTPLSFSVWYFDDGHLKDRKIPNISTGSPQEDIDKAIEILNRRFNLDCDKSILGTVTVVNFNNVENFFELIKEYVPKCMGYKVPVQYAFKVVGLTKDLVDLDQKIKEYKPLIWRTLPKDKQQEWVDDVARYYDQAGFPHYRFPSIDSFKCEVNKVINADVSERVIGNVLLNFSSCGTELANSYFPNMWASEVLGKGSVYNKYKDSEKFKKVIERVFEYHRAVSNSAIRVELKRYGKVHNFKPIVARYIYDTYCPDKGRILDYSAGWGGRLLGAYASNKASEYIGIEPSIQTFFHLRSFERRLATSYPGKNIKFINGCSEDKVHYTGIGSMDVCFSSPPYFNTEIYCREPTQSCIRYPKLTVWLEKYLNQTILNCYGVLKDNGFFIINIADTEVADLQEAAYDYCSKIFKFERYFILQMPKHGGSEKYEPIFVFKKVADPIRDNPLYIDIFNRMEDEFNNIRKSIPKEYGYVDLEKKYKVRGDSLLSDEEKGLALKMVKAIAESDNKYTREYIDNIPIRRFPFPTWVLENSFGTWNEFISQAGLPVYHNVMDPKDIVRMYLKECLSQNRILSFYEVGKILGQAYEQKLKRLFNTGRPYEYLKSQLEGVINNPLSLEQFLVNFK